MKATPIQPNRLGQEVYYKNFPFDASLQCSAVHPVNGQSCQYRVTGHPNQHCAMYEPQPGQTAFSSWPVAPVVSVEAPSYRIVPRWQKRLMMAGAVALVLSALVILYWLAKVQGVI